VLDNRIGCSSNSRTHYYVNERGHQVLEFDADGTVLKRQLWAPGMDQLLAIDGGNNSIIWTLTDQQGSIRTAFVSDTAYDEFEYDPSGVVTIPDPEDSKLGALQPLVENYYTGREYDPATGLYYNRARWYDPASGRFISEDPIGFAAGDANLYRYCGNSPTNATDPSGKIAPLAVLAWAIGTYLLKTGAESVAETYVESKVAEWTGDESFSFWGAFGRNMGVNTAIGWMPGAVETKMGVKTAKLGTKLALKTAQYGAEYAIETGVDVGIATLIHGRDFGDAFREAALGNALGHGIFRPVMHYAGRGLSVAGRWAGQGLGAGGRWIGRELRDAGIIDAGGINLGGFRITTGLGMVDPRLRQFHAPRARIHGNSLDYVGDTHVYCIRGPEGTHKIGQSMQGMRVRDSASVRAEQQVRKLNREVGPGHSAEIRKTFADKRSARDYETRLIERYRRMFGEDSLPGNKTNR